MPFREKMKSLVRTRSRGDTLTKSDSNSSSPSRDRWPSNVYKPGEPMPRPKYRAPPKKEHKEKLDSFSFADSWRRKSQQSMYSPMGTRAPSRRHSLISLGRRKSYGAKSHRTGSFSSDTTEKSRHRKDALSRLNTQTEAEGDDDVANVGMSRVVSRDTKKDALSRPRTAENHKPNNLDATVSGASEGTQAHDHHPFTEADLERALRKSRIAEPARA
ncbi:hypothetical protein K431DRAFT_6638 [Polychaeton citri CBS 116435]|uniref:Uncharacterized protein n=1 Tax=Polychaeton citri CBS 116435 TaxID=1314669 RepID=A0A9P4QFI2_9PEZI|nr:hypothetical protein K431DRAFT_6638 [Polychaeton citri CBS 116435]